MANFASCCNSLPQPFIQQAFSDDLVLAGSGGDHGGEGYASISFRPPPW
jgi:hypothetical protein